MDKFKLNSIKEIVDLHRDTIFPDSGAYHHKNNDIVRSITFREEDKIKLDKLRSKYRLSRSAIIIILLDNIELE